MHFAITEIVNMYKQWFKRFRMRLLMNCYASCDAFLLPRYMEFTEIVGCIFYGYNHTTYHTIDYVFKTLAIAIIPRLFVDWSDWYSVIQSIQYSLRISLKIKINSFKSTKTEIYAAQIFFTNSWYFQVKVDRAYNNITALAFIFAINSRLHRNAHVTRRALPWAATSFQVLTNEAL